VPFEETQRPEWFWSYVPERLVPLTHVHAEAVLVETTSEVKITQKYYNYQSKNENISWNWKLILSVICLI